MLFALTKGLKHRTKTNANSEAARMVYEGVRDVRRAVLQMRDPDTWDDSDVEHSQVSQDSGHSIRISKLPRF